MNKTKIKDSLEVATNVAVILVAVVLLGNLRTDFLQPSPKRPNASGFAKGSEI